ncbi:MAG: hypothetical protein ABIJ26_05730, partial [Candidatus Margulisiibacteriota bacterium]
MWQEFTNIRNEEIKVGRFIKSFLHKVEKYIRRPGDPIPLAERREILEQLTVIGMGQNDQDSIKRTLSRLYKFACLQSPTSAFDLSEVNNILPLIARLKAGLLDEELNRMEQMIYHICMGFGRGISTFKVTDHESAVEFIMEHGTLKDPEKVDRLAEAMLEVRKIFYEGKPLFYNSRKGIGPMVVTLPHSELSFTQEFLGSPSQFIEELDNFFTGGSGFYPRCISNLVSIMCDPSKLKRFKLGDKDVISKRIDPVRVNSIEEEINEAGKIMQILKSAGIENVRVPRSLALVYDLGNFYIIMEDEKCKTL